MEFDEIKERIVTALPGAQVVLRDFTGTGDHLEAHIVWEGFGSLNRVQQHRKVYGALPGMVGGTAPIHALALKTYVTPPDGWDQIV